MTTTHVRNHNGVPALFLNDQLMSSVTAYVGPKYVRQFLRGRNQTIHVLCTRHLVDRPRPL